MLKSTLPVAVCRRQVARCSSLSLRASVSDMSLLQALEEDYQHEVRVPSAS